MVVTMRIRYGIIGDSLLACREVIECACNSQQDILYRIFY